MPNPSLVPLLRTMQRRANRRRTGAARNTASNLSLIFRASRRIARASPTRRRTLIAANSSSPPCRKPSVFLPSSFGGRPVQGLRRQTIRAAVPVSRPPSLTRPAGRNQEWGQTVAGLSPPRTRRARRLQRPAIQLSGAVFSHAGLMPAENQFRFTRSSKISNDL